jgi:hypothetical protein
MQDGKKRISFLRGYFMIKSQKAIEPYRRDIMKKSIKT